MKEKIEKAIEFLKLTSLTEPHNIRVEEIEGDSIVLSYEEKDKYVWTARIYKRFIFNELGVVEIMKSFDA